MRHQPKLCFVSRLSTTMKLALLCSFLALAACGGGDGGAAGATGSAGQAGSSGLNTLLRSQTEPAGGNCATGGAKIEAGLDANSDSVLNTQEITATAYVCNGTNGTSGGSGTATLIASTPEPAGSNCPYAGSRITAGLDINGNTTLDGTEITSSLYVCNGAPGPGITWIEVTSTTAQAIPNRGYLANNNSAQVVVTLPTAPVIGDIVRISGVGTGGWRLAQNAGQSIKFGSMPTNAQSAGLVWTARDQTRSWASVASSADGNKLVAATEAGEILTSVDAGVNWQVRSVPAQRWRKVASSADGNILYATYDWNAGNAGVYTSPDAGQTWIEVLSGLTTLTDLSVSADGQKVFAPSEVTYIHTSLDGGQTWSQRDVTSVGQFPWAVASSAQADRLAFGLIGSNSLPSHLLLSTDFGATSFASGLANQFQYYHVSMSPDGSIITAYGLEYFSSGDKPLYFISTDFGSTWTMRLADREIRSSAMSADGRHLWAVGGEYTGPQSAIYRLYYTNNLGQTWQARESVRNWTSIASSQSGDKLVATAFNGQIYTSAKRDQTKLGAAGFLSGMQFDAVELQYIGGGVFIPVSYVSYSGVLQFN